MFKARESTLARSDRKKFESDLRQAEAASRAASRGNGPASSPRARGEALEAQGRALFRLGRFEEAVDRSEQAAELLLTVSVIQSISAFVQLSASLFALSRFEDVVRLHGRLEPLVPAQVSHWLGLAPISLAHISALRHLDRLDEAYTAAGKLAESLRHGTYSEQIFPGRRPDGKMAPPSPEYQAGHDRAFLALRHENHRTLVRVLIEQASVTRLQGQRTEAHELIDEAIKHCQAEDSFPEFYAGLAEALCKRGQLFEEAGDTQQAIDAYTEALSRFGDSADPKARRWADQARLSRQALRK